MRSTANECRAYNEEDGPEVEFYHREREVAEEIRDGFEDLIERVQVIIKGIEEELAAAGERDNSDGEDEKGDDGDGEDENDDEVSRDEADGESSPSGASAEHEVEAEADSPLLQEELGHHATTAVPSNRGRTASSPRRQTYWDIDDIVTQIQVAGEELQRHAQTLDMHLPYCNYFEEIMSELECIEDSLREIADGLTDMVNFMPAEECDEDEEDEEGEGDNAEEWWPS
ncbi:hypothetical protein B0A48_03657 [Cryoendolithus antarcticus]|uniref:Uncharacterized protein n=1 Tax=Cryoendolithus antarcticus TaxID=1507870 RepID=A0A1V8TKM8_9PEZI|nr:hypothetical protein B0A48_03657 [Cryoendolithus antarcticus]